MLLLGLMTQKLAVSHSEGHLICAESLEGAGHNVTPRATTGGDVRRRKQEVECV